MVPILLSLGSIRDESSGRVQEREEILDRVARKAGSLSRLGVRSADRVVLIHGNSADFFTDLLGLWAIGACAIPVDPKMPRAELATILKHAEAKVVISANTEHTSWNDLDAKVVLTRELEAPGSAMHPIDPGMTGKDDLLALILYTSGTTDRPKGVMIHFRQLRSKFETLDRFIPRDSLSCALCVLPTHFGHGLICNSLYPLFRGGRLVIHPPFDVPTCGRLGEIIDEHSVTFFSSVPAIWQFALAFSPPPKLGTLKRIHCASSPLSLATLRSIQEWAPGAETKNIYGLTETTSWIAGPADGARDLPEGCVGKGWDTEIRIVSDEALTQGMENASPLPPGRTGEVILRTGSIMSGYYLRPDLTSSVMSGSWFRTGDLGYLLEDGSLVLVGRKKDMINKAGMKVYPEDLDRLLLSHPDVIDACAFPIKNLAGEDVVGAAVVFSSEPGSDALSSLERWCRERIAPYKVPTKWFALAKIPRSASGKTNRAAIASLCSKEEK